MDEVWRRVRANASMPDLIKLEPTLGQIFGYNNVFFNTVLTIGTNLWIQHD
jgi:hypothetical protein